MSSFEKIFVLFSFAIALSGCSAVDQYAERVTSQNHSASQSSNEEILLNLLRAGDFRPLSFIAITQLSGGHRENIGVGLPTITFGPAQLADQRQYAFGNNSVSTSFGMSFLSNPLVTADFVKGQSAPIPVGNLAILLANYPRELVYYATIERIKVISGNYTASFANDPANNVPGPNDACGDHESDHTESQFYSKSNEPYCNFSKFKHQVNALIDHGVTAELVSVVKKSSKDDSDDDKNSDPDLLGQFCTDRSLARTGSGSNKIERPCGSGKLLSDSSTLAIRRGNHRVEVVFRSPLKIYRYLGSTMKLPEPLVINYRSSDAAALSGERFINVIKADGSDCEVSVTYNRDLWCVPSTGSKTTYALFGMLQTLRNLSISADDFNSSLTVNNAN